MLKLLVPKFCLYLSACPKDVAEKQVPIKLKPIVAPNSTPTCHGVESLQFRAHRVSAIIFGKKVPRRSSAYKRKAAAQEVLRDRKMQIEIVKPFYLPSTTSKRYHDDLAPEKAPAKTTLVRLQGNGARAPNGKRFPDFIKKYRIMKPAICDVGGSREREIVSCASNRFR